ncbi:MAG TPA: M1 family metallopeptidase [Bacteroidia bacterium]|nr:M1 family metallopeptidase [Bacteroidia bacterium]
MQKKILFFILCFNFCQTISFSQYFQQEVNYKINVSLDDKKHELNAFETIEYINNSPDELNEIYFHLWANAYKDNSTALVKQFVEQGSTKLYFAPEEDRGFVDSLDFKVNDKQVKIIYDSMNIDICKLILNEPLKSGGKIMIVTPFHVKIPSAKFSRMGRSGQAYYISQWYPKPAVYDRFGWHPMPYLDQGEFYSEFGSFEVSITVPKNYVVGATGDLQNEDEKEWLNKKVEETSLIKVFTDSMSFPKSESDTKKLTFKQSRIHDFAWFADKRFNVLKSEVELPNSKNKVTTWAFFTNANAKLWTHATEYIDSAVYYYSLWNGDYAYNNCTAVDGTVAAGGGMEYPNITIISNSSNAFDHEDVIIHEVGHNWFYGMLGSNERDHAWMDEGINSFNELRYLKAKYSKSDSIDFVSAQTGIRTGTLFETKELKFKDTWMVEYLVNARVHYDQPIDITSADFTVGNYAGNVYVKTALIFDYLKSYLGDSLFDSCMKQYFDEWKFKHPYPDDLRKIFENKTGKNLSWFFDDLLKTNKKIDYSISSIRPLRGENLISPGGKSYGITVKNKGRIPSPFSYSTMNNGEVVSTKWSEGFAGEEKLQVSCIKCDAIKIDAQGDLPELNRKNNKIKTGGIFRRTEPVQFNFFGKIENPDRTQVFFTPVIGWNNYNKTMAGIALYNKFLPHKNFEYIFMPMYSFGTKSLAGSGSISNTFYFSKSFIHHLEISAGIKRYAFARTFVFVDDPDKTDYSFIQAPVEFSFFLKQANARSTIKRKIILRNINKWQDENVYDGEGGGKKINRYLFYQQTIFDFRNNRTFDPFAFNIVFESGDEYMKTFAHAGYKFSYPNVRRGITVTAYGGTFLFHRTNDAVYNFRLSDYSSTDYLNDDIYLGRSEGTGILSQQTYLRDGGFKIINPGQSDKWAASLNLTADFPGKLPLRFFIDVGTYNKAKQIIGQPVLYDGGICLSLVKDIAEIYFPLFKSSATNDALEANDIKYKEQIRFMINFRLMNPFRLRDNLLRD